MNVYSSAKMLFDILSHVDPGLVNVTTDAGRILVIWKSIIPGKAPKVFQGFEVVVFHIPDKDTS